jgi:hypothetical protein
MGTRPAAQAQAPLVQFTNLRYDGAFRLPGGSSGGSTFDASLAGYALAYNAANNTLFAVGREADGRVAEVSIPTPTSPSGASGLTSASFVQGFADVLEGRKNSTSSSPNGHYIGGLLVWGSALISNVYAFYDADYDQTKSHYKSGLNFSTTGDLSGPFKVGSQQPGYVAGYMAPIPSEWQTALGGSALTGQCCIPIMSRTSYGPAASAFNPADVGTRDPVPATNLLGYDQSHAPEATIFKNATEVRGLVVPPGTRSALFFGRHGLGANCYGTGSECGDPTSSDKGYHAYPYVHQVWAYDLLDLAAVKSGAKQAWQLRPYGIWTLNLPYSSETKRVAGATIDPARGRIYVSAHASSGPPTIHVYTLTGLSSSSTVPAPTAPSNVRIVR